MRPDIRGAFFLREQLIRTRFLIFWLVLFYLLPQNFLFADRTPLSFCENIQRGLGDRNSGASDAATPVFDSSKLSENLPAGQLGKKLNVTVIRPLGAGGYGGVWLVHDPKSKQFFAVKYETREQPSRLAKEHRVTQDLRARYIAEHPELVDPIQTRAAGKTVLKAGAHVPFLETELRTVDGKNYLFMLADSERLSVLNSFPTLGSSTASLPRTFAVAHELIDAVYFLEKNNVLSQDVKPGNALLDAEGHVSLIDFGLLVDYNHPEEAATQGGAGSPGYQSLIQALGFRELGNDVVGLQQTLRDIFLGETARALPTPFSVARVQNGNPYVDYAMSPRSINFRVPETFSAAM
jgi:serine/threonine protein kinase